MLSNFARAYQSELLRSSQRGYAVLNQNAHTEKVRRTSTFGDYMLASLGDLLISLGERLKGQSPCPELTHGQA